MECLTEGMLIDSVQFATQENQELIQNNLSNNFISSSCHFPAMKNRSKGGYQDPHSSCHFPAMKNRSKGGYQDPQLQIKMKSLDYGSINYAHAAALSSTCPSNEKLVYSGYEKKKECESISSKDIFHLKLNQRIPDIYIGTHNVSSPVPSDASKDAKYSVLSNTSKKPCDLSAAQCNAVPREEVCCGISKVDVGDCANECTEPQENLQLNVEKTIKQIEVKYAKRENFAGNKSLVDKEKKCDDDLEQVAKSKTYMQPELSTKEKDKRLNKIAEKERTRNHISYLKRKLPDLDTHFNIHGKIGEGSFSSVFLGTVKSESAKSSPHLLNKQFAIKHLVPTILPRRIVKELRYLQEIGGKDNVVGVDLCLRKEDCVVFIMPYLPHKSFSIFTCGLWPITNSPHY